MAVRDHYPHGQFCWVDLVSRDMSEARDFYRRLFGWQSVDSIPRVVRRTPISSWRAGRWPGSDR